MKKNLFIAISMLIALGCTGHRSGTVFKPITSNGEQCLSNCNARKAQCFTLRGQNPHETDENSCEKEYDACLKPCVEFDEMIKKAM